MQLGPALAGVILRELIVCTMLQLLGQEALYDAAALPIHSTAATAVSSCYTYHHHVQPGPTLAA
jgi:hypothetical protein